MLERTTSDRRLHLWRQARVVSATACLIALGLVGLSGAIVVRAGDDALPDAATILDGFIKATGGKAAYEKIHNRVITGRIVHVGMGFEDSMSLYQAEPSKRYFHADSEALGTVDSGTNGEVAWYVSEMTGPLVEEGQVKAATIRECTFNGDLLWRDLYKSAECVGQETVDGKACYKVVMAPNEGGSETRYYDKQSNLLHRIEKTRISCFGSTPVTVTFGHYKQVDGLLLPVEVKQEFKQCGDTRAMLFVADSIKHNVDIPSNRFDPPEVIQALVKSGATGQPGCAGAAPAAVKGQSGCGGKTAKGSGQQPGCGKKP